MLPSDTAYQTLEQRHWSGEMNHGRNRPMLLQSLCGFCACLYKVFHCFVPADNESDAHRHPSTTATARYQAPAVSSGSRLDHVDTGEDDSEHHEQGRLLPKGFSSAPGHTATSRDRVGQSSAGAYAQGEGENSNVQRPKGFGKSHKGSRGNLTFDDVATVASKAAVDDSNEDCCPTCLELYTEENPKIWTSCGHHFHMPCIFEWAERKDTCPMCESKVVLDDIIA